MADQFDSVTGGGNGFSVNNVQTTSVTFNVPTTGTFDIYISDTYAGTASRPSGTYDLALSAIQVRDSTSPAQIQFLFPSTGVDPGGAYTSEFTATWSDPTEGLVQSNNILANVTITNNDPSESFPDGKFEKTSNTNLAYTPPYHIHQDDDFLTAWADIATAMTELAAISTELKGYTESIKNDVAVFKSLGTNSSQGISTKEVLVNTACNAGGLQPAVVIDALQSNGTWDDVLKELGDPLYMPSGERQSDKDKKP